MTNPMSAPRLGNDRHVLLVDDERSYLRELGRAIRRESGLPTIEVADGLHALNELGARDDIAVIVSDERLKVGPPGSMLLEEVARRWPRVRRMLLSAWTTDQMVAEAPYLVLDKRVGWWVICGAVETLAFERDSQ